MVDINNVKNYKKCQKKLYNVWVCMPPKGTIVINKIEQAGVVRQFRRDHFTISDIKRLSEKNPGAVNVLKQAVDRKLVYTVDDNARFVLSGTVGEMWTIKFDKLAKTYTFADGTEITPESLKAKCAKLGDTDQIDWVQLITKPDKGSNVACFVPKNQPGQLKTAWGSVLTYNDPSIQHGFGDFIVSTVGPDGGPTNDRWVVNGLIFRDTYDNRGWSNCVEPKQDNGIGSLPKPNFSLVDKTLKKDANAILASMAPVAAPKEPVKAVEKPKEEVHKAATKNNGFEFMEKLAGVKSKQPETKEVKHFNNEGNLKSNMYELRGRYQTGIVTTGYHLVSGANPKGRLYTKEQLAFLVGRGRVSNVSGVTPGGYVDDFDGVKLLASFSFVGNGVNITELPVIDIKNDAVRNSMGHTFRGEDAQTTMNKVVLIGVVKDDGRKVDGYVLQNSAGRKKFLTRDETIDAVKKHLVGNARINVYNGKALLRSIDGQARIGDLPLMTRDGQLVTKKPEVKNEKLDDFKKNNVISSFNSNGTEIRDVKKFTMKAGDQSDVAKKEIKNIESLLKDYGYVFKDGCFVSSDGKEKKKFRINGNVIEALNIDEN